MRRLLLAACAAIFLLWAVNALADSIPDGPGGPSVAIENTSMLSDTVLARDLPYFQTATNQVCAAWHCNATLYLAAKPRDPRDWVFKLVNRSDIQGAIAYHAEKNGLTYGVVGVQTAVADGMPWGVALTHELDETLIDPEANAQAESSCPQVDPASGAPANCTFYSLEIADPVEAFWYRLGPVRVSDFVYRSWFQPDAPGPYDALHHLDAPFQISPAGYAAEYLNGEWQFSFGSAHARVWDRFGRSIR